MEYEIYELPTHYTHHKILSWRNGTFYSGSVRFNQTVLLPIRPSSFIFVFFDGAPLLVDSFRTKEVNRDSVLEKWLWLDVILRRLTKKNGLVCSQVDRFGRCGQFFPIQLFEFLRRDHRRASNINKNETNGEIYGSINNRGKHVFFFQITFVHFSKILD